MYLYGKNSILERLKENSTSIKEVYFQKNFKDQKIIEAIENVSIPTSYVSEKELLNMKRADRLQGIVARVDDFKYASFEELLYRSKDKNLSFVFADNINDPHNLGSILRITACFGNFAVVIPKHRSCEVNDTVMHVASGGENFVPVCMVTNMTTALLTAKENGYWIVGTVVGSGEDVNRASLPFPLCLVLGSEGKGIRYGIEKHLDLKVSLPMPGAQLSLNVAMACAIFCHEITKKRLNVQKN